MKEVKANVGRIHDQLTAAQLFSVVEWLEHTNPCSIHNRSQDFYEEHTGKWVQRCPEWADFVAGRQRSLWISGIPGAGKTVLSSHLVEELRHQQNSRTGWVYYYCYFARNQDETGPFLRWALSQLCHQANYVPADLFNAYSKRHEPDNETLLSLLADVLTRFDAAFVAMDAVDESMPYTALLGVLKNLMTDTRFERLRLLLTSRQYLDIEKCIKPYAVSLPMSNRWLEEDIRIYVRSKLYDEPKFRQWPGSRSSLDRRHH
ncbi:hypothetical protein VTK26DRAFT_4217 [Humicola hyalothermophila]